MDRDEHHSKMREDTDNGEINTQNVRINLLDYPEVKKYIYEEFNNIIQEADRGAILLSACIIEASLQDSLQKIAPKNISKKRLTSFFDYNGTAGTFSDKINIAFFMGILDEKSFGAIESLRKIRNKLAHDIDIKSFSFEKFSEEMDKIYNFIIGMPNLAAYLAMRTVKDTFMEDALKILSYDGSVAFADEKDVLSFIKENQLELDFSEKINKLKLAYALAYMKGFICFRTEKIIKERQILSSGHTT